MMGKEERSNDGGDVCDIATFRIQFDIDITKYDIKNAEDMKTKCMKLKFIDQATENKFQILQFQLFRSNQFLFEIF